MPGTPATPDRYFDARDLKIITILFMAILGIAAILALLILLLPGPAFLAFSNYLQIIAAVAASLLFLYAWHRSGKQEAFIWAAVGFGLWGIANISWYLLVLIGQRAQAFPGMIDIAMIVSFLVLAESFRTGFPEKKVPLYLPWGIIAICFIIPAGIIVLTGVSASTFVTLLYFLACGTFLAMGIQHSRTGNPALMAGSILFALAFMIYPVREMFFIQNPVLPVIGTFVAAGFSLMVLGWFLPGKPAAAPKNP
ncbi:MAG: hypothetical protein M0Q92_07570 [Methanoregula sp.]|jgi:hypothetical protein|nr:hypothetical protein [Methanoregula sp.]